MKPGVLDPYDSYRNICKDNFDFFLQTFCFGPWPDNTSLHDYKVLEIWTYIVVLWFILEFGVALFFLRAAIKKRRKLKIYDPLDPDNNTYCVVYSY